MSERTGRAEILHFQRLEGEWPTRFHLRVDPDGGGILLANAAAAAYLSPAGVIIARMLLEGRDEHAIRAEVLRRFPRAPQAQVQADLEAMRRLIADLAAPGDNYPITNFDDPDPGGWTRILAAPLRADVEQTDPDSAERIITTLWAAGVPHITILAQPQADRGELPRLVQIAEDIGMICGLRAVASWLEPQVIQDAALVGLDHLDLLYVSPDDADHDRLTTPGDLQRVLAAFRQCRELELSPVAQVPALDANADILDDIVRELRDVGVNNVVCFALACPDDDEAGDKAGALPARSLPQVATVLIEAAEEARVRYIWTPPVRFDPTRSLAQQVQAGPRTAGDIAVRVRADGSVLPPRGRGCAGNLLTDAWEDIWANECFTRYHQRLRAPTRCPQCPDLPICAADCPKDPAGWSDDREEEPAP